MKTGSCSRSLIVSLAFAAGIQFLSFSQAAVHPTEPFTVEIDTANPSTRTLISSDNWRYFKGSVNPNAGWEIADDVFLGGSWLTGSGGFGYEDGDDLTNLGDMRNNYSTVYIRKSFVVPGMTDPQRLKLQIDYDDAFVAWLDGKEIARAHAPGAVGVAPAFSATATNSHEAAGGTSGNPVETYTLPVQLGAIFRGTPQRNHVLAIQGLNRTLNDDDFSFKATLLLDDYFTLLTGNSAALSGQITLPGATRVTVNGQNATLHNAEGRWSRTQTLAPGMNRLIVEAWDATNHRLAARTNDVVSKPSTTVKNSAINNDTTWGPGMGVIEVASRIVVGADVTLTISPGTTLLFRQGGGLFTQGGHINASGNAEQPIYFLPVDGRTPWNEIAAANEGSITLRHSEMVGGMVRVTNRVTVTIEDSVLRDSSHNQAGLEQQIMYGSTYCDISVRRTRVSRFYEMSFGAESLVRFEDCVVEYAEDDAIKFDDSAPGSYIRRCLVGPSAPGDDAIDFGAGADASVEDCLIQHIFDRGISIGEVAQITVSNCLIHHTGNAIGVKDSSLAKIRQVTLADSAIGLAVFEKFDGGGASLATATNSIIWGNATNVTLRNPEDGTSSGSEIKMGYSVVQGSPLQPGTANLNSNPQFVNAAAENYRLAAGSPARNSGQGGVDRGVRFPVGPAVSLGISQQPQSQTVALHGALNLNVVATGNGSFTYQWQFNGTNLSGATSATYTRSNFQTNHQGQYRVVISNGSESVTSDWAMVLLNAPLRISGQMEAPNFQLRLIGPSGTNFVLQASPDFMNWTSLSTNAAPSGVIDTTVAVPPAPAYYYRFFLR